MKTSTIEALIWILVYGGLLVLAWGLSVQRSADALGYGLIVGGGFTAAIGFALIYVRSRMKETVPPQDDKTP
jgi:hypothetical protein